MRRSTRVPRVHEQRIGILVAAAITVAAGNLATATSAIPGWFPLALSAAIAAAVLSGRRSEPLRMGPAIAVVAPALLVAALAFGRLLRMGDVEGRMLAAGALYVSMTAAASIAVAASVLVPSTFAERHPIRTVYVRWGGPIATVGSAQKIQRQGSLAEKAGSGFFRC